MDVLNRYTAWKRELTGAVILSDRWNSGKTTRILKKANRYYVEVESDAGVMPEIYDVTVIRREDLRQYLDHSERVK